MKDKEAKRLLVLEDGRPTPQYQAYLKFAKLAAEKEREMNEARQIASQDFNRLRNWPIIGKSFNDELQQARDQWIVLGHKNEIEQAINVLKATGDDTSFLKPE